MSGKIIKGRVIKSTGSWYRVKLNNSSILECRIKGNLRLKGVRSTNPVAVGDIVHIEYENNTDNGIIVDIEDRKNFIVRKSINLSKKLHILAANIDRVFIIITIKNPRTPYGFIDRMLVTAEAYGIPASIIFNKRDTWNDEDQTLANEIKNVYQAAGYNTYSITALEKNDTEQFKSLLKNKITLLIGHSGTGKSTLINSLNPDLNIKTSEISTVHLQGRHTTTFAEMHPLDDNTFIIDSPGIREFGLINMDKYELSHYFPEMRDLLNQCRFDNCLHLQEPGCAVKQAVKENKIPFTRYRSYISMIEEETEESYED